MDVSVVALRPSRRVVLRGAVLFALVVGLLTPSRPADAGIFTRVTALAAKTGYRLVFAWEAKSPVVGEVEYGLSPGRLDRRVRGVPGVPDASGMAVVDVAGNEIGRTFYWRVRDLGSGGVTATRSIVARNAWRHYDGSKYNVDLLIQLDTEALPSAVPFEVGLEDIAAGVNVMAERLYDAVDGYARIGTVLITDTVLDYPVNVPFDGSGCRRATTNVADVLVQSTVPFDSHTWSWAIADQCRSIYLGRIGQLIASPWGTISTADDLHFGYVATHELLHYAFGAPDLYPAASDADCRNEDWDGSIMHNTGGWNGSRWEMTELDRSQALTPCDHGTQPWSWSSMRSRYSAIPSSAVVKGGSNSLRRGNPDGGKLKIFILDREPGASTLRQYKPVDAG